VQVRRAEDVAVHAAQELADRTVVRDRVRDRLDAAEGVVAVLVAVQAATAVLGILAVLRVIVALLVLSGQQPL